MEGVELKDFTSTSFGLAAAYFLPGLLGLFSVALFWRDPNALFCLVREASKDEFSVAVLLFFMIFGSLLVGVLIEGVSRLTIHWSVEHKLNADSHFPWLHIVEDREMKNEYFAELRAEKLACFLASMDEYYRFHQFFGNIFVVAVISYFGLRVSTGWPHLWSWGTLCYVVALIVAYIATKRCWDNYADIGKEILGVGTSIKSIVLVRGVATHAAPHPPATLTVHGEGFSDKWQISWDAHPVQTTHVSGTELHATIPEANIGAAGTAAEVRVIRNQPSIMIVL